MITGPRYKIAKRLGASVFEKAQTQKFALSADRSAKNKKRGRGGRQSEYGKQMLEKQKARYSYGVGGAQFTKYVRKALQTPGDNSKNLIRILEGRLDNVVVRSGFAPSRSAARQMVSHGHITVDGKIVNIPSYDVHIGDKVGIREGSRKKALFAKLDEELANIKAPVWLAVDAAKKEIAVNGEPAADAADLLFDIGAVLEFYTR